MSEHELTGIPVFDANGQIGRVVAETDPQGIGHPSDLWIKLDGEERPIRIPQDQINEATPERVSLAISRDQLLGGEQTIRVPLHEEVLAVTTHVAERGRVRIHKTVETVPHEETVSVGRDEVSVERVSVGRIVDRAPAPRWEGETLIVPLVDEVLVVEKRLRVREELRITRTRVAEQRTVREDLRREVADIETTGETGIARSG